MATRTVHLKSKQIEAMQPQIRLVMSLLGGTSAMRASSTEFLPKFHNEEDAAYQARLSLSTLHPAFARTVETLTGKPFSQPMQIDESVPQVIEEQLVDVDLEGRNLDTFAADAFEAALGYGIAGILVEYPTAEDVAMAAQVPVGQRTLAQEKALGLRPYLVLVYAYQLIACKAKRVAGKWTIMQLRFFEWVEEDDPEDEFVRKSIEQIRVLEPGRWRTFRRKEQDKGVLAQEEWEQYQTGETTLDFVPFVPLYGKRQGFMVGKPPLLELAQLNVKHWRSQSDQDNLLHVARVPILVASGIEDEKTKITVGAQSAILLPAGAKLEYVEHRGTSLAAGQQSLDKLVDEMQEAGAELLLLKPGKVTATEIITDNAVGMCALQRMTLQMQDALNLVLDYWAKYLKLPQSGGKVTLFNDYGAATLSDASAQLLVGWNQSGKLSDKTTFEELQRRGVLSADRTFEEEQEELEKQGPTLGELQQEEMLKSMQRGNEEKDDEEDDDESSKKPPPEGKRPGIQQRNPNGKE